MTTEAISTRSTRKSRAWVVLFVLGILLALNMVFLLFIGGSADQFEADTGIPLAELTDAYPTVAQLAAVQEQLVAVGYLGFALFVSAIAYFPYRAGERWARYAMWIMPGILALTAVVMIANGSIALGGFYAAIFIAGVLPLVFSMRTFIPKDRSI